MAIILDGDTEIGAHVRSNQIFYMFKAYNKIESSHTLDISSKANTVQLMVFAEGHLLR